jgi:hypothetical protein
VYTPVAGREEFLEDVSRETATGLMSDFGAAAIAGFVEALDQIAPQHLRALRTLIDEKLEDS